MAVMNNFRARKQSSKVFASEAKDISDPNSPSLQQRSSSESGPAARRTNIRHSVSENISLMYHSYIKYPFGSSHLKGYCQLPLHFDISTEEKRMGPLFLQKQTWKTSKSFMKLHQHHAAQWLQVNIILCRENIFCTLGLDETPNSIYSHVILEDIPLDLSETIQYGRLKKQEDSRWMILLEQSEADLFGWNRWLPGSKGSAAEGIIPFEVDSLPLHSNQTLFDSGVKEQNHFLRLSVRCAGI